MGQQQSARLARYNRAVVLDLIRRFGPISKSELAERSGLAVSSVLNVLGSLSKLGLVREVGLGPSTGGRPPTLMELNPDANFSVGVNVRPTYVEAVLLDLIGSIRAETVLPLQGGRDPAAIINTVVEGANQVIRLAQIDPARVLGVGVGVPGPVMNGRVVVGIPGFPWESEDLAEQLERRLGLPVVLENDANCGALAEFRHGTCSRDQDCTSMVFLYVDYGVGAGIVVDGNLFRGIDGTAGEVGHMTVDPLGPRCLCGNYGCLEAVASVESLVRRTVVESREDGESGLASLVDGDWEAVSFEAVMEAVGNGDAIAVQALDQALAYLAVGVSNISRLLRPRMIVLGGYLFERADGMVDRLKAAIDKRPALFGMRPVNVVDGELGGKACSIGAGALVLENFFGEAQQVMSPAAASSLREPAFEHTLVWPRQAEQGIVVKASNVRLAWAGNLEPGFSRVRSGDPISVTVDVRLVDEGYESPSDVKVLLHWDRVAMFGGNWPAPKNSPMQLLSEANGALRFGITLGSLPPGRYEYAAHALGKNDIWVRNQDEHGESNGRVEVIASRAAADREEIEDNHPISGKEADRPTALVEG